MKVRENKSKIPVVAHDLFSFDFFFSLNGLRAGVWRTRDICIGGKDPTNISFANIGNQVMFLDTMKYFQQSLGALANSSTDSGESTIRKECKKIINKDENFSKEFNTSTEEDQGWVINYLSTGKGTFPYEMITRSDSLDISPEEGNFFLSHHFFSSLEDDVNVKPLRV